MSFVAPEGGVYQAGTLSGNPLAMTAGIETLKVLSKPSTYKKLEKTMQNLEEGLKEVVQKTGIKVKFYRAGTMFCTYFTETEVVDAKTAKTSDTEKFKKFFRGMLERGIYIAPSQFEAGFISLSHKDKDIEKTIKSAYEVFKGL
jgi:glutamate-1-semialdehyde 2,1-aminomutase